MSAIDFLKTKTSKDDLAKALAVIREFKDHESTEEWLARPFACWTMLEMLEEYLDHLVAGKPLKDDTLEEIK